MLRGWCRPLAVLLLAGGLVTGASPPAADAHTRTQETTNVVSRIADAPLPDGVSMTVHTGGLLVEVVNRSTTPLVVHGYDDEPYLRIGPDGVERNRRSPATYINESRYGDVAMPRDVDARAAPEWIHLDDRPRALWHDHRTHWMSTSPPRFVDAGALARILMATELVGTIGAAGEHAGAFRDWVVPLTVEGERVEVAGALHWEDSPGALPWLALAVVLIAPAMLGLRHRDVERLVRPAALMVGAVAAANGIHLVDDLIAWPGAALDELFGLLHTSLFLTAGLGGAVWAYVVRTGRVLALGVGSASVLYHQGLVHLPMLYASQFPTVWADGLVRLTVALGLAQAAGVAVVVLRVRRVRRLSVRPVAGSAEAAARHPATEDQQDAPVLLPAGTERRDRR